MKTVGPSDFPNTELVLRKIEDGKCRPAPIGCGGSALEFRDPLSRRKYDISGLCQDCQDEVFGGPCVEVTGR